LFLFRLSSNGSSFSKKYFPSSNGSSFKNSCRKIFLRFRVPPLDFQILVVWSQVFCFFLRFVRIFDFVSFEFSFDLPSIFEFSISSFLVFPVVSDSFVPESLPTGVISFLLSEILVFRNPCFRSSLSSFDFVSFEFFSDFESFVRSFVRILLFF